MFVALALQSAWVCLVFAASDHFQDATIILSLLVESVYFLLCPKQGPKIEGVVSSPVPSSEMARLGTGSVSVIQSTQSGKGTEAKLDKILSFLNTEEEKPERAFQVPDMP